MGDPVKSSAPAFDLVWTQLLSAAEKLVSLSKAMDQSDLDRNTDSRFNSAVSQLSSFFGFNTGTQKHKVRTKIEHDAYLKLMDIIKEIDLWHRQETSSASKHNASVQGLLDQARNFLRHAKLADIIPTVSFDNLDRPATKSGSEKKILHDSFTKTARPKNAYVAPSRQDKKTVLVLLNDEQANKLKAKSKILKFPVQHIMSFLVDEFNERELNIELIKSLRESKERNASAIHLQKFQSALSKQTHPTESTP